MKLLLRFSLGLVLSISLVPLTGEMLAIAAPAKILPPYVTAHSVVVDGISRHFYLVAPSGTKALRATVFMFHGHGGSPEHMLGMTRTPSPYVRWLEVARRQNLLLIIPEGAVGGDGKRGWADCRFADSQPKTNDLAFVDAMIAKVNSDYPAIAKQIFAVGTSNGGHFVLRLAHERPSVLKAAAVVVASEAAQSRCAAPSQALPIVFMNGTDDTLTKWQGGLVGKTRDLRGETMSVMDTVNYWVKVNNAEAIAKIEKLPDIDPEDKSRVVVHQYAAKVGGAPVVLYEVQGGGHTEPSTSIAYSRILSLIVGNQNRDIEMADKLWDFFAAQQ
jgi:polyhydroxybutyrate depolymerase